MKLKLVTSPVLEPISLTEAKEHLRVDGSDEDNHISSLITAAREVCEGFQNRAYVTQTWELVLDDFPAGPIKVPKPPLQGVDSIKCIDQNGAETIMAVTDFIMDDVSQPGKMFLSSSKAWPSITLREVNGIRIQFKAGYGDPEQVPEKVKQAMKLLIGQWYENRENVNVGNIISELPFSVKALLWQDRVVPL